MRFNNFFFDLDNTLWAFSENAADSFKEIYELYQLNRYFNSFEQFYGIYQKENKRLWKMYEKGMITKDELNRQRFYYPLKMVNVYDYSLAENYSADFFKIIRTKKKLMPHTIETLDYLQQDYNLYILSNGFHELQYSKMKSAGIYKYFKKIVLSDDIGINKPNPKIFTYALTSTNSNIENSIMIGDDFDVDIVGAHNIGLPQVYYNTTNREDFPFHPNYQITDLKDLVNIIS